MKSERKSKSKIKRKLYMIWYHMRDRCYNKNHERYRLYGGQGVCMCDDWLDLNTFREQVVQLDGFNEDKILKGLLHLDKDVKSPGNKIYSPENCSFISKEENNKVKPNQMYKFKATSPQGNIYFSSNQSEFARMHNLDQSCISSCLRGSSNTHKGWRFEYKKGERLTTIETTIGLIGRE